MEKKTIAFRYDDVTCLDDTLRQLQQDGSLSGLQAVDLDIGNGHVSGRETIGGGKLSAHIVSRQIHKLLIETVKAYKESEFDDPVESDWPVTVTFIWKKPANDYRLNVTKLENDELTIEFKPFYNDSDKAGCGTLIMSSLIDFLSFEHNRTELTACVELILTYKRDIYFELNSKYLNTFHANYIIDFHRDPSDEYLEDIVMMWLYMYVASWAKWSEQGFGNVKDVAEALRDICYRAEAVEIETS